MLLLSEKLKTEGKQHIELVTELNRQKTPLKAKIVGKISTCNLISSISRIIQNSQGEKQKATLKH